MATPQTHERALTQASQGDVNEQAGSGQGASFTVLLHQAHCFPLSVALQVFPHLLSEM